GEDFVGGFLQDRMALEDAGARRPIRHLEFHTADAMAAGGVMFERHQGHRSVIELPIAYTTTAKRPVHHAAQYQSPGDPRNNAPLRDYNRNTTSFCEIKLRC
ncbi:hypothetical protein, partial [Sinorhizobium medicae]